jgi:chitin disaccharide deacetylase
VQAVKNLIVNADDLGWTEGVNRGIAEAHRNGIVTSASLLANGAAFTGAVELVREIHD